MSLRWAVVVVALCLSTGETFSSPTSDFGRLLANPKAYDGKRLTIIGIADVYDVGFFFYERALSAYEADRSKSVFVVGDLARRLPDNLNKHWLKVTGVVNAKAHGPWRTEPCEITIERYEVMAIPALKEWRIFGVFRNETSSTLKITVSDRGGYGTTNFSPGKLFANVISPGSSVEVKTLSGRVVAKLDLELRKLPGKYFDSTTRNLFYRVTAKKIEQVPAGQGKQWLSRR